MRPASEFSRMERSACPLRPPRGAEAHRRGFTLLEVMIAMAILAITLVTVYQSQSQSISMASDARFLTTASLLAQARMVEVDAGGAGELVSGKGDFGKDFPAYAWQVEVGDVEGISQLKKVVVTVTNVRMTKNNAYRLILYKVVLKNEPA